MEQWGLDKNEVCEGCENEEKIQRDINECFSVTEKITNKVRAFIEDQTKDQKLIHLVYEMEGSEAGRQFNEGTLNRLIEEMTR